MTVVDNDKAAGNGVNVQALLDAREVLKGAPEAAQFTWRASSKWQYGVHSTTKVSNFFGLGQEQRRKAESVFDADHPEVFAAEDSAITPIEYLLVGLAGCLTAGVTSVRAEPWHPVALRSRRQSRVTTTSAGSSAPTRMSATVSTTSR